MGTLDQSYFGPYLSPAYSQPYNCCANPTALPPAPHRLCAAEVTGGAQEPGLESRSLFGAHRAIASLVTSLCFHFLGTNRDKTIFSFKLHFWGHRDAGRLRES